MPTRYDIAKRLYGRGGTYSSASGAVTSAGGVSVNGSGSNVSVRYGTATSDSEDGWVWVRLDTSGISGEEAQDVHCVCDSPISEGQRVCVLFTTSGTLRAIPIGDNIVDQIGTTVTEIATEYAGGDSDSTAPTDGWSSSWPSGYDYVWQRTKTTYSDGTVKYSTPVCIDRPPEGYDEDATFYAMSSTSAATATKVATLVDSSQTFTLEKGVVVAVTFTYANTASSPRLNVASTGAKYIRTLGTSSAYWEAGATVNFVYDGTYWQNASSPVWASTVTVGNSAAQNMYIDSTHLAVRNGTTEYSTFSADEIHLGLNDDSVQLFLMDDRFYIAAQASTPALQIQPSKALSIEPVGFSTTDAVTAESLAVGNAGVTVYNGGGYSPDGAVNVNGSIFYVDADQTSVFGVMNLFRAGASFPPTPMSYGVVTGGTLLYVGSTTGSVTLRNSSDEYWRIDIYFAGGTRVQMASTCGGALSQQVSGCSGRSVSLVCAVCDTAGSMYISAEYVTIAGQTISRGTGRQLNFSTGGWSGNYSNNFEIVAVVGWGA